MSKGLLIGLLFGGVVLLYSGNKLRQNAMIQSNEVKALSGLQQWKVAASVAQAENGKFPSAEDLLKVGLCAYPAEPGSTGNKMILLLLDESKREFDQETGQPTGKDNSFQIWTGQYVDYGEPVTN